jgi:ankyrin repeat protein
MHRFKDKTQEQKESLDNINQQAQSYRAALPNMHRQAASIAAQNNREEQQNQQLNGDIAAIQQELNEEQQRLQEINEELNVEQLIMQEINQLLVDFTNEVEHRRLDPVTLIIQDVAPSSIINSGIAKETIENQKIDEFDQILTQISNINLQDSDGKTLLMHSIIAGFRYGVEKLLAMGADVNLLDDSGHNALIYVSAFPNLAYLEQIARSTNDLDIRDKDGNNPLHLAIKSTRVKLFSVDINMLGGDVLIEDLYVETNVIVDENITIRDILGAREDGYTVNQIKTLRIIDLFSELGMGFNAQNNQGQTAFMTTCMYKIKYLANTLLDREELIDHSVIYKT